MIRVKIERKQESVTWTVSVVAPSIERALELVGADDPRADVRVVFPIDDERFFVSAGFPADGIDYGVMTSDEIEGACEAGLDFLRDDLGAEGFEVYAYENALI